MTRTPAVMEIKLKPCPFCRSADVAMLASNGVPHGQVGAGGTRHVECNDCYATGPAEPSPIDGRAWNTRTPDEPLAEGEMIENVAPFNIGDEVAVIPDCDDWAADWQYVRLWVAAINAVPGGGFDYWVCDTWPLPVGAALTDGFYMGCVDKPDTLSLVARAAAYNPNDRLREALERARPVVVRHAETARGMARVLGRGRPNAIADEAEKLLADVDAAREPRR